MIREYISRKGLIEKVLTTEEILLLISKKNKVNIVMGQTFDSGQPVDMIKYALFIMNLHDMLEKEGSEVTSNWVIADHFMTQINQDKSRNEAKNEANARIEYLKKLNESYGGRISFVMSSSLTQTQEYQDNLSKLKEEMIINLKFREKVSQAVPEDRRNNPSALNYPLEELATIQTLKTDIKVGPKYEIFYDDPAREFSGMVGFKKYSAVYLTNVFPLGNPEIPEELKREIEVFGVLPYKKNSKGLRDFRIDPVNDDIEKVKHLIESTKDERALSNLLVITELARQRLRGRFDINIFSKGVSYFVLDLKKELAFSSYQKYIHNVIGGQK